MRKAVLLIIICISAFLSGAANAAGISIQYDNKTIEYNDLPMTVSVNGKFISMPLMPIVFNDRALVPVREVLEAMSAVVSYDSDKKEVNISHNGTEISIAINSNTAYVNNKSVSIPDNLTPKLINKVGEPAKTMVPIRFLSETLGMNVHYNSQTRNIAINSPDSPYIAFINHSPVSENQYLIKLTANCPMVNVEHQVMQNPLRLVIDVHGISNNLESCTVTENNKISEIRFGYENNRSRIVVDLKSIYSYKIITTKDNNMIISLLTSKTDNESPVTSGAVLNTYSATPDIAVSSSANKGAGASSSAGLAPSSQAKKVIVIDAGHGLQDGGAEGKVNIGTEYEQTIYEKNLTLSVSQKIKKNLQDAGISVVMTRDGDTYPTLYERAELANSLNAAMFISIHINSSEKHEPSGTETYYCKTNDDADYILKSSQLAKDIQTNLIANLGTRDRGVKTANFVVIKETVMPSVLVELGFISNEEELKLMCTDDFQTKAAKAVSDAIIKNIGTVTIPG